MDPVTQGLLGACVGQLGFRRRIGKETGWLAAGSAMVPDLDIFLIPLMSLSGIEHGEFGMLIGHRGISHSLLLIPLYSLPIAIVWWWIKRKRRPPSEDSFPSRLFTPIYLCVLGAMLSGPLLDLFTAYGTQIFSPLTNRRFALDAIAIVDFIYTPLLLITLILCAVLRRTKKNAESRVMKVAIVGFALSLLYLTAGLAIRATVLSSARQYFNEIDRDTENVRYGAYPQIPTVFVWRLTREDNSRWTAGRVNILFGLDLTKCQWTTADKVENQWVQKARILPDVKNLEWFAMGQTRADYAQRDGTHIVTFSDMRYGIRPESVESLWGTRVMFDAAGGIVEIEQISHYGNEDFSRLARRLWGDIFRR